MGLGRYLSLTPTHSWTGCLGPRSVGVEVRFLHRFQDLRPSGARAQGWVNVVRAWPVPDSGNTKAAFSLWVCVCARVGGVAGCRQSRQHPMAHGTRAGAPMVSACRRWAPRPFSGHPGQWDGLLGLRGGRYRRVTVAKTWRSKNERKLAFFQEPHAQGDPLRDSAPPGWARSLESRES